MLKNNPRLGEHMYQYTYWGNSTQSANDNMALEEYFLNVSAKEQSAHIRFYDFDKDTVVLRYNQSPSAVRQWTDDFNVTRRGSGGSHVQVGGNILAYSFIIPRDGNFRSHPKFRAYYAEKVADALEGIGLTDIVVDNDASTIMTGDRVVASHALKWNVRSALLHGIVMITPYDVDKIMQRVYLGQRTIGSSTYTEASALRNIPTLTQALPNLKPNANAEQREHYFKQLVGEAILKEVAGKDYRREELSEAILQQAREYHGARYSQPRWLKRRLPTFTPEEVEELPGETLDDPLKKDWGYCLYIQVPDKKFKNMAEPEDE